MSRRDPWVDNKWQDPAHNRWALWQRRGGMFEIWQNGEIMHGGCWSLQEAKTWVQANWQRIATS